MHQAYLAVIGTMLAMFAFNTSAQVAQSNDTWYVAVKGSLGETSIDNITDRGSIGTGELIDGFVDGQIDDETETDYTAGVGFAIGKRIGYWNASTEFIWRYRTDWNVGAPSPTIQTVTNVVSDVETTTLLFNLGRRWPISQNWSWEAGAGIGLVHNQVEAQYREREVPGVSAELTFDDDRSSTDFSYNVFLGLTRAMRGPWTMNLRYRYIDLGDLQAGPFPMRPSRVFGDFDGHEVQLSFERDL